MPTLLAPRLGPASRELVERLVGRRLSQAEQALDVVRLDGELERAKDDLEAAIRDEMIAATLAWASGMALTPALRVTPAMLEILDRLRQVGRDEALRVLERLGYRGIREPARAFAADPRPDPDRDLGRYLRRNLPAIATRIEDELVVADLSGAGFDVVAGALLEVPGARDIASRVISTALIDGLALTFEDNADLVRCWQYSAVLDGRTCGRCRPLDGTRYSSLEELFAVLPNFGPNPSCLGGGRCRCTGLPCDPEEVGQVEPGPGPVEPDAPAWAREIGEIRASAAIDDLKVFEGIYPTVEELEDLAFARRRGGGTLLLPGERMIEAEARLIRAGELVEEQVVARAGPRLVELDVKREVALARAEETKTAWNAQQTAYRAAIKETIDQEQALLDRLEIRHAAPGRHEWEVFELARKDPELVALRAANEARLLPMRRELDRLGEVARDALAATKTLEADRQLVYRGALRETLEELRPMGPATREESWTYTTAGRKAEVKVLLDDAAELFPRSWIDRGRTNPIKPELSRDGRGRHKAGSNFSKIRLSDGGRGVATEDPAFPVAVHELGHHIEHVDRRIRALQWAFYQRRTRTPDGEQEPTRLFPRGLGYRADEVYRQDEFLERYMGKTYGNSILSHYELLTMGLESVWTGSYNLDRDPEYKRWILGLLAVL